MMTPLNATQLAQQQFNFPDGGWVCSQCHNYNFYGRVKCNRCQKIKGKNDFNGKPKHLLKKNSEDESMGPQTPVNQMTVMPLQINDLPLIDPKLSTLNVSQREFCPSNNKENMNFQNSSVSQPPPL